VINPHDFDGFGLNSAISTKIIGTEDVMIFGAGLPLA
jgi:hypothetical protein